jgi:hypothetical protein
MGGGAGTTGVDASGSVAIWRTRDLIPVDGKNTYAQSPCQWRRVNFCLADSYEKIDKVYRKIFMIPEGCARDLSSRFGDDNCQLQTFQELPCTEDKAAADKEAADKAAADADAKRKKLCTAVRGVTWNGWSRCSQSCGKGTQVRYTTRPQVNVKLFHVIGLYICDEGGRSSTIITIMIDVPLFFPLSVTMVLYLRSYPDKRRERRPGVRDQRDIRLQLSHVPPLPWVRWPCLLRPHVRGVLSVRVRDAMRLWPYTHERMTEE